MPSSPIHQLLIKTTLLTLHHTYRQHYTPIIDIVLNELDTRFKEKKLDETVVSILMSLITMFVTVRKGSRIENYKPIISRLEQVSKTVFGAKANAFSNYLYTEVFRSITGTLYHGSLEVVISGGRVILDTLNNFNDVELVYGFYLALAKLGWSNYTQICLPYIIK